MSIFWINVQHFSASRRRSWAWSWVIVRGWATVMCFREKHAKGNKTLYLYYTEYYNIFTILGTNISHLCSEKHHPENLSSGDVWLFPGGYIQQMECRWGVLMDVDHQRELFFISRGPQEHRWFCMVQLAIGKPSTGLGKSLDYSVPLSVLVAQPRAISTHCVFFFRQKRGSTTLIQSLHVDVMMMFKKWIENAKVSRCN